METIKKYIGNWDFARIFKLVLGIILAVGYFSTKENMYIFGSLFFTVQAVLNIGCPGGTCNTNVPTKNDAEIIKVKKYEPTKNNADV